jgi:cytochrome c oxidase cbb3-type subunit 3
MTESDTPSSNPPLDDTLRPHSYDGIQEYDKQLPRWWLLTLYGAMVFAALYWAYNHTYQIGTPPAIALEAEMRENTARVSQKSGAMTDDLLWKLSTNKETVEAGRTTFLTTCAACHKPDLTGLIGPNLVDNQWIHGGKPLDVVKTINEGVLAKGMPAWGPLLGRQKITEVTAFIFSHHKEGEEIVIVPGWTPPAGAVPPPPPAAAP